MKASISLAFAALFAVSTHARSLTDEPSYVIELEMYRMEGQELNILQVESNDAEYEVYSKDLEAFLIEAWNNERISLNEALAAIGLIHDSPEFSLSLPTAGAWV